MRARGSRGVTREDVKQYIQAHTDEAEEIQIRGGRLLLVRDLGDLDTIKAEAEAWVGSVGDIEF